MTSFEILSDFLKKNSQHSAWPCSGSCSYTSINFHEANLGSILLPRSIQMKRRASLVWKRIKAKFCINVVLFCHCLMNLAMTPSFSAPPLINITKLVHESFVDKLYIKSSLMIHLTLFINVFQSWNILIHSYLECGFFLCFKAQSWKRVTKKESCLVMQGLNRSILSLHNIYRITIIVYLMCAYN